MTCGLTESELKFYNCNSIPYHCSTCANSQDSLNEINSKTSTLFSHSETDEDGSHFCNNSLNYNIHETCNKVKSCNTQDALTIFHMNVRSLSKNLYKLENFLLAIEHCPDIKLQICLSVIIFSLKGMTLYIPTQI